MRDPLDCGCLTENVELFYMDDVGTTICEPCFQKRIIKPDGTTQLWHQTKAGDLQGYGELWTWHGGDKC